jgi:hypothetical protein
VRYETMMRLGYFVTESSEHFAEYVPWFIKRDRPDLIDRFGVPLDEYPRRCVEQVERWEREAAEMASDQAIEVKPSHEYASDIVSSVVTGEPSVIYGNVPNRGLIPQLPQGCAVEVPTLVDSNRLQPTRVENIPPQLIALMRTNVNVQELTVAALLREDPEHLVHAAMLDPHTAAELDLDQIVRTGAGPPRRPWRLGPRMGADQGPRSPPEPPAAGFRAADGAGVGASRRARVDGANPGGARSTSPQSRGPSRGPLGGSDGGQARLREGPGPRNCSRTASAP